MHPPRRFAVLLRLLATMLVAGGPTLALNPNKSITQYTRTVWTQADGLPQDTIHAIAQTGDGYLWVGTSEGLVRFDGYDFVTYSKEGEVLPSNLVTTLTLGHDGTLWVGTSEGLVRYHNHEFLPLPGEVELPAGPVNGVVEDRTGAVWVVVGGKLCRLWNEHLEIFDNGKQLDIESVRVVYEDPQEQVWVAGVKGLALWTGNHFRSVLAAGEIQGIITHLCKTEEGLWFDDRAGLHLIRPDGTKRHFSLAEGLASNTILSMMQDSEGSLWVGTYGGLSRREGDGFVSPALGDGERDRVWALLEDREGDLWVGAQSSLTRLRDDRFTMFGKPEGLPSDEPSAVYQSPSGELWVGYRDHGLASFLPSNGKSYTTADGLLSNEVNEIRGTREGDLLVATTGGLSRLHRGSFINYRTPDVLNRTSVYAALEDRFGDIWAATASGVFRFHNGVWTAAVPSDTNPGSYVIALTEGEDGSLWAGSLLDGIWRLREAGQTDVQPRQYTTADGLGGNRIRSFSWSEDGTLWIGTFGGGLTAYRKGKFHRYGVRDGLLSDNVAHILNDGAGSLWLSTTRGICRVRLKELEAMREGRLETLETEDFGFADGLRNGQLAPELPAGGGSARADDGSLWFPTSRGLATIHPKQLERGTSQTLAPTLYLSDAIVNGDVLPLEEAAVLPPGTSRLSFRYAGIHVSAPEKVRYFYRIDGLDSDWVPAEGRRFATYTTLPSGDYVFAVRATIPGGQTSEVRFAFVVQPHFYQTGAFLASALLLLVGSIYGAYRLRLAQVHSRFAVVVEERARMAREIHDTLSQGFVGISHQLDAMAARIEDPKAAQEHLNLARKMARYSLTEARRSVLDLRTSELENQDLAPALRNAVSRWTAGLPLRVDVESCEFVRKLPVDLEQNLLRICQEAIANVSKHANATRVEIKLFIEQEVLHLQIADDGTGFETNGSFTGLGGHFGIVGMRERAERFRGKFSLYSRPGDGTRIEVEIPLTGKTGAYVH